MTGPPARQKPQDARELLPAGAELIDESRRVLRVRSRDHKGISFQLAKPLREHIWSNSGQLLLERAESLRTLEQGRDYEQSPAVTDRLEGVAQRR
jgi:hypothetical protein